MQKALLDQNNILGDIFIPTSNRIDALTECLKSVAGQTDKRFRVLLIGKKSSDAVVSLIKKFKGIKIEYYLQKRPGLIGAANEALAIAKYKYFTRIDDDVILNPAWFENIIKTFNYDDKTGGVTGPTVMSKKGLKSRDLTKTIERLKNSHNPILKNLYSLYFSYLYEGKIFQVSQFLESGLFTVGSNYPASEKLRHPIEVSNLEACNWSARTSLIKRIGGFDKIYLKGLGDFHEADSALKIKNLGYKLIFNSLVKLQHNVEFGTIERARPHAFYRIQNFIIFYFRFFKVKSLNQLIKFSLNLIIQNGYYIHKFFFTGDLTQLFAIPGTVIGLFRAIILPTNILNDKS